MFGTGYAKYLREQAGALAFEARVKSLMSLAAAGSNSRREGKAGLQEER